MFDGFVLSACVHMQALLCRSPGVSMLVLAPGSTVASWAESSQLQALGGCKVCHISGLRTLPACRELPQKNVAAKETCASKTNMHRAHQPKQKIDDDRGVAKL